MPRWARSILGGLVYHVLNRANGRMRLFHKPGDYEALERHPRLGRGHARAAASPALSLSRRWASLPRSIQKFSRGRGQILSGRVPIRRGESAAREARRPGRTVAVERTVETNASRRRADPERVAGQASVRLAGSGQRPNAQGAARRTARVRSTRPAVWSRDLGTHDRRKTGPRLHPPRPRPPQDNRQ
jgi:hypothetical protein